MKFFEFTSFLNLNSFPSLPPKSKNKYPSLRSSDFDNKIISRKRNLLISDKRAFLLGEETLKIVIAVIAISFLIYFLVTLYYNNVNDKKVKQAEETLLRIEEVINGLSDEPVEQDLINPPGWHLIGFTEDVKPNSCGGINCLCICADAWDTKEGKFQRQEKKCDEKGFCLKVENLVSGDFEIKIEDEEITFILIQKIENEVVINEV